MNKFVAVKAVSAAAYDRALARLSAGALDALTFHPDRIWLYEDRERLTFFASYALQAGAGFRKDYVDFGSQHVFAFDGLPYTRDIDVDRSWAAQIDEAWSSDQAALENIFGTWAAFRMDHDALCALSDFTGMTPLFYWHDADYLAISTRQMLLTTSCGAQVPNLEGLAWLTGQANLIGDQTAWQGVRHLPPQWTLSVSRRAGDLQPVFSKREIWTTDIDLQFEQADIDDIAHKLLEQCEALNRLPLPPLQVDITGGLDSRLTAALLSASSLRSRISHLQTRGVDEAHEIQVGRAVAAELGLEHRAITASASVQTADWILDTLRASTFRYEAGICPSDGLILAAKHSRVAVTGAAGEIYRRHCKPHMKINLKRRTELLDLFQSYHQKNDPLGIQRPEVCAVQSRAMQTLAAELADQGADLNDITDVFFMRFRLPLWNGILLNNIYGSVRAYPLVNYHAAKYAFSKGYASRVSDRIHFELLLAINPGLCAMPFLGFTWPEEFNARAQAGGVALPGHPYPVTGTGGMLQASGGSQLSRMMGDGWRLARTYLLDRADSEIWSILDRRKTEKLFCQSAGSIKSVVESKQVFAALGLQCALSGDYVRSRDGNPATQPTTLTGAWGN